MKIRSTIYGSILRVKKIKPDLDFKKKDEI